MVDHKTPSKIYLLPVNVPVWRYSTLYYQLYLEFPVIGPKCISLINSVHPYHLLLGVIYCYNTFTVTLHPDVTTQHKQQKSPAGTFITTTRLLPPCINLRIGKIPAARAQQLEHIKRPLVFQTVKVPAFSFSRCDNRHEVMNCQYESSYTGEVTKINGSRDSLL